MQTKVSYQEALKVWLKVAIYSFGGPAGQIAVMHKFLVEEKKWVSESRFLHALNYAMLLPGPEAQQLATYIGWLLHGTKGGLTAGGLFILPGFIAIMVLSILYAEFQEMLVVQAIFFGLKPAVMAIVAEAVVRIGRRALKNEVMVGLAAVAFVAIFFLNIPFPLIIFGAGCVGYVGGRVWLDKFDVIKPHSAAAEDESQYVITDQIASQIKPSTGRALTILAIGLTLWFAPLILIWLTLGSEHVLAQEALFFSKMAVVTFGGAYAVLAYVAQQAVDVYGWLQAGEMLDGLGMAETTPGPLIQVVQFVGFMGAYRQPGELHPLVMGALGAMITVWVTYVPCFLWIFLGAPYIEYLRGNKSLSTALSAITAAVVGVILNLAVWFSLHTLFSTIDTVYVGPVRLLIPEWSTLSWASLVIAAGAGLATFRFKVGMLPVLAGSAAAGLVVVLWQLF